MSRRSFFFFTAGIAGLLSILTLSFTACTNYANRYASTAMVDGSLRARSALTVAQRRNFDKFYLEALRQKYKGNDDAAYDLLARALEINRNDADALYQQAMLVLQQPPGVDSVLLMQAEKNLLSAQQLAPSNLYYIHTLAAYWLKENRFERALRLYENITCRTNDLEDLRMLVRLYAKTGNYEAALQALMRVEAQTGEDINTVLQRYEYLSALGRKGRAFAAIREFSEAHPDNLYYRIVLADSYVKNGHLERGREIIEDVRTADPHSPYVPVSMLAYYEARRDRPAFERQFSVVMRSKDVPTRAKVSVLQNMMKAVAAGQYESLSLFRHGMEALGDSGAESPLPEMMADYVEEAKLPQDSLERPLRFILRNDSSHLQARVQCLRFALLKNKLDEADSLCAAGRRIHPEQILFYYFGGVCKLSKNDEDGALAILREGTRHIRPGVDSGIVSNVFATMGDILYEAHRKKEAFASYDQALSYDKDNALCLNNYAYYLTLAGIRLPKARQMAKQAVALAPGNAGYLDTYAWSLFRSRHFKEAKIYMDSALSILAGEDAVELDIAGYYDRAGDIYFRCGRRTDAVRFWQRALAKTADAQLARKLRTKIRRKRL